MGNVKLVKIVRFLVPIQFMETLDLTDIGRDFVRFDMSPSTIILPNSLK